ncbi:acyl-CoA dehydrogenase [Actinomycetospora sp. NBRC 106375]|uniref:acyl-CoA dehydrogenase family protein n=1 Tax=Actinomycetospora sp. NBRC 106375 TaxID=3032207 RepID=UPI00249FE26C|nr:acyl-CoA dehydrogenase family protein [Actinomycetospora sp. NBRC 106375]GLZ44250.1 acyl-CoA dehydrogenase [Actinomycetospora sp. NBRC 106375]
MTHTSDRTSLDDTLDDADYGVPWALDDHHRAWQRTVREFCAREVAPGAAQRSIDGTFDADLARAAGLLGAYGLLAEERFGGGGADLRTLCVTAEEMARVDSSLAVTVHVQAISVALLAHLAAGRDDLLAEVLPDACAGETFVSFGLTEPTGGSDAGNIGTTARRDGDDWVISGSKQFITNSGTPFSRYVILFAATGEAAAGANGRSRRPVSAFLVPLQAPGVTVGGPYAKLGWRASDTHPLFFDEVRVPGDALLGEEGRGYREALGFLTWARFPIAAMSTGLALGCLDDVRRFVGDRTSFGSPLGAHQGVAFGVADIAALAATARVMTYDGAWKYDHGRPIAREAATAKLVASEAANKAAYLATELAGGYGFMQDTAVTRHYQDARILTIGEGTSEVQRLLIARGLGLPV